MSEARGSRQRDTVTIVVDESCPEVDGVSYMPGVYKIPMVRIVDVSNLLTNPRMYGSISGLSRNA